MSLEDLDIEEFRNAIDVYQMPQGDVRYCLEDMKAGTQRKGYNEDFISTVIVASILYYNMSKELCLRGQHGIKPEEVRRVYAEMGGNTTHLNFVTRRNVLEITRI